MGIKKNTSVERKINELFGVTVLKYPYGSTLDCVLAYNGIPSWLNPKDGIGTVNFTKTICEETARLIMQGTSIRASGARGEYIQNTIDKNYKDLRDTVEYAMAYGTVIVKPNGVGFDCVLPDDYRITEVRQKEIVGAAFIATATDGDVKFVKIEYHRFEGKEYRVSNRCFRSSATEDERLIPMADSPWSDLVEDVSIGEIEHPLFAVLRTPQSNPNTVSPLGLPIVSGALPELRDLDVAYSRMTQEIADSKRTILMDSDRLFTDGGSVRDRNSRIGAFAQARQSMGLPDAVTIVGNNADQESMYQEINPTLNTDERITGLNYLLQQIGYKAGFANGHFVFNEQMGIQTATGVEANQQRTIQFIKDCRDRVEDALRVLIYGLNVFADLYDLAPRGDYEVTYQFGDITYNEDEDRARWLSYANSGKIPFWFYLVKFEGFTEEEAKALTDAAKPKLPSLFPSEE